MEEQNKVNDAAEGIMDFIIAIKNTHFIDELSLLTRVKKLCHIRINVLEASHPERNK